MLLKPSMKHLLLFVSLAVAVACPQSANADSLVYSAAANNMIPGGPYNWVPLAPDSTPNRPIGSQLGNTITLGGTARYLTTVDLGLFNGGGGGGFTLYLYGGADPNSATLLGQESASIGGGISPSVLFDFTSLNIVLPNTITFIVGGPADNGHGPLSAFSPTVGSAPNSMWYGPGNSPAAFVTDSNWAVADGGQNNLLAAQFFANDAAIPEPTSVVLMVTILFGVGITCRRSFAQSGV